jgi:hypothetical protein
MLRVINLLVQFFLVSQLEFEDHLIFGTHTQCSLIIKFVIYIGVKYKLIAFFDLLLVRKFDIENKQRKR